MRNFGLLLGIMFLSACADRSFTPVMPDALNVGSPVTILAATTRAKNLDGSYGFDRSEKLSGRTCQPGGVSKPGQARNGEKVRA
jgi:hypothetical protein